MSHGPNKSEWAMAQTSVNKQEPKLASKSHSPNEPKRAMAHWAKQVSMTGLAGSLGSLGCGAPKRGDSGGVAGS